MSEDSDDLYRDDPRATVKQVGYVRLLCRDGWLGKSDFPSSRAYYRKRTMTKNEADALIKLGRGRMTVRVW